MYAVVIVVVSVLALLALMELRVMMWALRLASESRERELTALLALLTNTVTATSSAIGEAVSASLVPPPAPATEKLQRVLHDIASDNLAADSVDDADPTDRFIFPGRPDAAFSNPNDINPFGVEGMQWSSQ